MEPDSGKYIVLKEFGGCDFVPFIFSPCINHADMVRQLGQTKDDVLSAGFVSFGTNKKGKVVVSCYGKSDTLGKKSNPPRDSDICTRLFRDSLYD